MPSISPQLILEGALPGSEIFEADISPSCRDLEEKPWKFWLSNEKSWAVYVVAGSRLASTTIQAVQDAARIGLNAVLIACDPESLGTAAAHFGMSSFYVACNIAGRASLIPPISPPTAMGVAGQTIQSRIPSDLLVDLAQHPDCPRHLQRHIQALIRTYSGRNLSDEEEYDAINRFATSQFNSMGFGQIGIPTMLRRLEAAGYGGRRDHFFHSFHNFFIGLLAVMRFPERFKLCQQIARLHFDIDPLHVWFLTAIWHDAGYAIANCNALMNDIFFVGGDETAEFCRAQFLKSDIVIEGCRIISSLMARLLRPSSGRTQWLAPRSGQRRSSLEKQLEEAIKHNVRHHSHGAASALRLYVEYIPLIKKMGPGNALVLEQMVYLACASMPFHDWAFRDDVRHFCGGCCISTDVMPFAGLLAFVDSIQDDRRDLQSMRNDIPFLERLQFAEPAIVTAQVNIGALLPEMLLGKIVEARDVKNCLSQRADSLSFMYPSWMVA